MVIPNSESTGENSTPKDNEAGYQNAGVSTIPGAQPTGNSTAPTFQAQTTGNTESTTTPGEKTGAQLLDW